MSKTVMIDWTAVAKDAVAAARATRIRYYTAEAMAEAALAFIPADIVAHHDAKFGFTMLSVLTRRIAQDRG